MSEESFHRGKTGAKTWTCKGACQPRASGVHVAQEKASRGPAHAREQSPGTSDHRDAPTSESPREETEGALSLRTCLTASAAHFRSTEGSGDPGAGAGQRVRAGLGPRGAAGCRWSGCRGWAVVQLRASAAAGLTLRAARLLGAASAGTEAWPPGTRGIGGRGIRERLR